MTFSRFHSGTHMADRICWMRIDWPASKRSSVRASDVSTATRSRTTVSTIVWENVSAASAPARPLWRARVATSRPLVLAEDDDGPLGGQEIEEQVHDLREDLIHVGRLDERAGDLDEDLEDLLARLFGGCRRPASVPPTSVIPGARGLEVEVAVEIGDRADERRARVADRLRRDAPRRRAARAPEA